MTELHVEQHRIILAVSNVLGHTLLWHHHLKVPGGVEMTD
jgi:hypothetical protein